MAPGIKLTSVQVNHFEREGYLVVKGLLDPVRDLDPIIEEYAGVLDRLINDFLKKGMISSAYADLSLNERLIRLCQETNQLPGQHFDFSLPQKGIKADTPLWVGPAIFKILRNDRLLDAVESIIGPEIYSNPVQHVRFKLPDALAPRDANGALIEGPTPWHQDHGTVLPTADKTKTLTVWFPLWDVPTKAGCLQVLPRSHKQGLLAHCQRNSGAVTIPGKILNNRNQPSPIAIPLKRGDALFMDRLICHSALPNLSRNVRWSMDLRYNPNGQATGRDVFPGFVARSRLRPEAELHDAKVWAQMWYDARRELARAATAPSFHRWGANATACA